MSVEQQASAPRSWFRDFLLTSGARFGLFFALFLVEPVFPLYLKGMGASSFMIGLVMAAFPFGATVVRPLVGAYIDRLGSKLFLVGGLTIFITAVMGYIWTASVFVALILRTYHGFGWSGCTTSVGTLVADIAPDHLRGTLISYSGAVSTVAYAIAAGITFTVVRLWGFPTMFLSAVAVGALGLLAAVFIREPARVQAAARQRRWFDTFILPESLMPAVSMSLLGFLPRQHHRLSVTVRPGGGAGGSGPLVLRLRGGGSGRQARFRSAFRPQGPALRDHSLLRPVAGGDGGAGAGGLAQDAAGLRGRRGDRLRLRPCGAHDHGHRPGSARAAGSEHGPVPSLLRSRHRPGRGVARRMLHFTGNNYPAMFLSTTVVGMVGFVLFMMKYRAVAAR